MGIGIKETGHAQICRPVAAQLRWSMGLASLAQLLKLSIWLVMIQVVYLAAHNSGFPFGWLLLLLGQTIVYYTLKIKAHDQSHYAAFQLEKLLRQRLSRKISELPLGKVRSIGSGALAKVLLDDVRELHAFVADAPPLKAEAYTTPIFVLAALLVLDWRLGLMVLGFALLMMLLLNVLFSRGKLFRRQYGEALASINGAIIEYVQGMSTIRTFDAGNSSYGRFKTALNRFNAVMVNWLKKVGFATRLARSLFTPMPMMIFLITIGVYLHSLALLSLFSLFAFLILAAGLIETMHPYMGLFHLLEKSRAAIERINELENMSTLPISPNPQKPSRYDIEFDQVSFSYTAQDEAVLKQLDLKIPEQSFTAIIGASGSGKTTLINLLLRFWDVSSGSIKLGGIDIRQINPHDLMTQCSVVFQDNFLFSCSIAENISYGLDNVEPQAIIDAAKKAHIHDFIMSLPQQYQTPVGERGQLLSGGQKQRLTIARAFLQNRPILILDEPTAFSDAKNEANLVQVFNELMRNKTVIMIAHRLSSITSADQILYMEHGRIIAQGNHHDLLQSASAYRTLWQEYQQARAWSLPAQASSATILSATENL
ncbi:ABC transporter ATP-binding protein [Testudinibacter sp. TR-2022]|uniref:ABC transporter ATP-binding protein n=1 Tax=Testudinibacter sp. TR-2022 TaxID=2585029 RepID=UPI0011190FBC|nr:ABC transporter ATP-binding protein [Testudinibacter sp. TR-2022]TNH08402.1 ABC transporter ATP-binding protein [Pasteurellaceae bacterium Phil11]TNH20870.1 ABC transporter ATP-binding protein [Testudinibacter sp. TR-2022]TNH28102.1 ABC transporter ATP-binding protein [Testudinibacter sp. TR-2022]